jgi:hypothetical protein
MRFQLVRPRGLLTCVLFSMNWSKTMCGVLTEAHSRSREAQDVLCVALTKPSSPYSRRDGWTAGASRVLASSR